MFEKFRDGDGESAHLRIAYCLSLTNLFRVLCLRCPTFKVSIFEETRRFGNVLLKLNVTSSKNESGDDATVSVDTDLWREEVVGRWQAGLGSGQFLPRGAGEGGIAFPSIPWPGRSSQAAGAAGAGALGRGPFRSAGCSPHPVLWPQLQHPSRTTS